MKKKMKKRKRNRKIKIDITNDINTIVYSSQEHQKRKIEYKRKRANRPRNLSGFPSGFEEAVMLLGMLR